MHLEEPSWWYPRSGAGQHPERSWPAILLAPVAVIYGVVAARRMVQAPLYRAARPVVCVGNLTVGGSGKTPLAIEIACLLRELGVAPWFLTRGYGGRVAGPHRVDPDHDRADQVGDEPLLLAAHAPAVVARDRMAGARLIESLAPAEAVIVMDDGLQNPTLAKDLVVCAIDRHRGVGNGSVFPAGPLRAPVKDQLKRVDAIVVTGAPATGDVGPGPRPIDELLRRTFPGPVLAAETRADGDHAWLAERPVIAYAGIANPARVHDLVRSLGGTLAATLSFPDHHTYSDADAERLLAEADRAGAILVTTAKDHVRLASGSEALKRLHAASRVIAVRTVLPERDRERLASLLRGVLKRR